SRAVQTTGFEPVQVPDWQVSVCVHALLSLHAVPFVAFGFVQTPVPVSQTPATWHWSRAVQTTGVPLGQAPDWHVSLVVQALPSEQDVPFAAFGFVQTPVPVLQTPATWHWSSAVQTTGFAPVHVPDWHVSV